MASSARSIRRRPSIFLTLLALFTCLACAFSLGGEEAPLGAVFTLQTSPGDVTASDRAAPADPTSYREHQAAPLPCELVALEAEDAEVDAAHDPAAARIHVRAAKLAGIAHQALPIAPVLHIAELPVACAFPRGPPAPRA